MITLNEHIKNCIELQKQGYGELPCIYTIDDHLYGHKAVTRNPFLGMVKDTNDYYLISRSENEDKSELEEKDFYFESEEEEIKFKNLPFTPNCVIIN